jgi:hypothetical protein
MWIIQEPRKVALWNKRHFEDKNGECAVYLKYSVLIFVEKIYIKWNIRRVAVRPSYIWDARFLKVNTGIYVFLLLWLYILIVCLSDCPDWGFSLLFPQLYGKCQGNPHKDGARPTLFLIVLFYVFVVLFIFVLFYVLFVLCRSLHCLCIYVWRTTATGWLPKCS